MGILDFIFGKKNTSIQVDNNTAFIKTINFTGEQNTSENKQWIISWGDYDSESQVYGYRNNGKGKVVLFSNTDNKIVSQIDLERPNSCNVANNGNYSVEEWFFGDGLKGTFFVFSHNGEILLEKKFKANIISSGLSIDGQYAICQTGESDNSDGNLLTLFDILNYNVIFSVNTVTDYANSYIIDSLNKRIIATINQTAITYDFNGNILDIHNYYNYKLESDRFTDVLAMSELLLKQNQIEFFEKVYISLEKFKSNEHINDNNKAKIFKLQGNIFEIQNNNIDALYCYNIALELNSKIGLKKKIEQLKEK